MKKPLLIGLAAVILIALIINITLIFANNQNSNDSNSHPTSTGPIILKVPVTETENPSDPLPDHTIVGYNDKTIELNDEFLIDPSNIDFGLCAPKIEFGFDGIYDESVALSITGIEFMDGDFVPQSAPQEKKMVSNGTCVSVGPMCTDLSVSYCFEIKKNAKGDIELYYAIKQAGIMPLQ